MQLKTERESASLNSGRWGIRCAGCETGHSRHAPSGKGDISLAIAYVRARVCAYGMGACAGACMSAGIGDGYYTYANAH